MDKIQILHLWLAYYNGWFDRTNGEGEINKKEIMQSFFEYMEHDYKEKVDENTIRYWS